MQVLTFKTRQQADEYAQHLRISFKVEPERGYDPEDPNADKEGYVWVIAVTPRTDADTLYMCTDGYIR